MYSSSLYIKPLCIATLAPRPAKPSDSNSSARPSGSISSSLQTLSRPPQQRRLTARQKQFRHWKYGTINVSTVSEDWRLEHAISQVALAGLTLCAFQETRRCTQGTALIPSKDRYGKDVKYEIHWCGYQRKKEAGVGIAILQHPLVQVLEVKYTSALESCT